MRDSRRMWGAPLVSFLSLVFSWVGAAHAQDAEPDLTSAADVDPSAPIDVGGDSSVDRFYGEFNERIPIIVPPFHGVEPKLALHYHSGDGDGFAGMGWSLTGIGQIERGAPGRGAPTWTGSDIFLLAGQPLVPCAAGSASPSCATGGTHSTQIESYRRIAFDASANTWTVTAKDGMKSTYTSVYGVAQGTFRWGLTSVADTHGNTCNYSWSCDPGADCYPSAVTYNGTTITFYKEPRPDPVTFANGSVVGKTSYRLKTIDVTVSGARARAYKVSYTTSASSSRSLVASVQQFGKDATLDGTGTVTGGTAYPATSASYRAGSTGFSTWNWNNGGDWNGYQVHFADFNGDGKVDLMLQGMGSQCQPACPIGVYMALSTGTGFNTVFSQPTWDWSGYNFLFGDFNGDGKADLFIQGNGVYCATGNCPIGVYMALSTGTDFSFWTWPQGTTDWSNYRIQIADFNGDGKADIFLQGLGTNWCFQPCVAGPVGLYLGLSSGTGFSWSWSEPSTDWSGYVIQFHDFNGDGKADIFLQGYGQFCLPNRAGQCPIGQYMGLGTGSGFSFWTWSMSTTDWSQYNMYFADFDGDGTADMYLMGAGAQCGSPACPAGQYVGLSAGTSFSLWTWAQPTIDWSPWTLVFADFDGDKRADLYLHNWQGGNSDYLGLSNGAGFTLWSWNSGGDWSSYDARPRDFSGDGKADLYLHGWTGSAQDYMGVGVGVTPDLVTAVNHPYGGTTTVGYAPSSSWANTYLPFINQTVTSYALSDWRGDTSTSTKSYAGGLYDPSDRRFLGFHYEKDVLPCNPEDGGACPFMETWFHQDYGSRSMPDHVNRSNGAGTLLTSTVHEYTTNGATLPYTSLETGVWAYLYDGTGGTACPGANCKRTLVRTFYDEAASYASSPAAYGNPTTQIGYGDYDVDGDEVTSTFIYAPNPGAFITGLQGGKREYARVGTTGTMMADAQTYYDGATAWSTPATRGDPTQKLRWISTSNSWIADGATFDTYGNRLTVTDAMNDTTTTTYDDTFHQYPASVKNALGQVVATSLWDGACAKMTSNTGPNGASDLLSISYDALCRQARLDRPLGNFAQYSYVNIGSPTQQYIQVDTPPADGTTTNQWTRSYFDGRARTYQTARKGPSTILQVTTYNPRGDVASKTDRYYSGATPNVWSMTYDALDRRLSVVNPDSTAKTSSYSLWVTRETDEMGHARTTMRNAYENKAIEQYVIDTTTFQTSYVYDPLQRLVGITDAAGNAWSYAYDSLGRRTSTNDPDLGSWTTAYDAAGRVTHYTDAKGQTVAFGYDALGRKTSETMTNPPTTYTWTYDQPRAGYANVGHMTLQGEPSGEAAYNFDLLGRLVQEDKSIGANTYSFSFGFDAGGRLKWTVYPDGDTMGTPADPVTYDAAGRPYSIPNVLTSTLYTAYAKPSIQTNANGTTTTVAYDGRQMPTSIATVNEPRPSRTSGSAAMPTARSHP